MTESSPVIIPALLQDRFALAFKHNRVILFHAPCGSGKTTVAKELLKGEKTCYLSVAAEDFSLAQVESRCKAVILDDLHLLESGEEKATLCELLRTRKNKHFVLLTRGSLPGWLMPFQLSGVMESFEMKDLMLDKTDIQLFAREYNVSLSYAAISAMWEDTKGYPVALAILMRLLRDEGSYNKTVLDEGKRRLFLYFDDMVYLRFEKSLRQLLVRVAPFASFTAEMAILLDGDKQAGELLGRLLQDTSMFLSGAPDVIVLRPIFRAFLLWKLPQVLDGAEQKDLFLRAGLYYEMNGEMKAALDCYSKVGDHRKISELLIKNAEQHVGIAQYYELEQYYFAMPESEIMRSPTLMAGMSLLCAMFSDFEASDRWYDALKDFVGRLKRSDGEFKNAQSRLAYLDIALPQRGNTGLFGVITNVFKSMSDKQLRLPPVSITSGRPSVLNGGKDFTEWTKQDTIVCNSLRKPSELILGRDGVGLMDCALCESFFEKNHEYQPKLLAVLSRLPEIQRRGSPDVEFAAVGLIVRIQLCQGQSKNALDTLESMRDRFIDMGETRFLANIDALCCRIYLQMGNLVFINRWLEDTAPKDDFRVWALHRYQYLTKVMALIATGEEDRAMLILPQLRPYVTQCGRILDSIAIHTMSALCYFRTGHKLWQEELSAALDLSCEYHYIRPMAEYGAALLPLLTSCLWKEDKGYLQELIAATREQAIHYPLFLKKEAKLVKPLSTTEQQVLKLLCHNLSNQEISDLLGVQIVTVKAHVGQILKKLGVNRRMEAKEAAEKLGLL